MTTDQLLSPLLPQLDNYGPYKFLDYFVEADRESFMGRVRDIEEVVARLSVDRSVVLYGRSGLGKTSLVLAGIFPIFRERGFQPIHCRVLEDPVADLTREMERALNVTIDTTRPEAFFQVGGPPLTKPVLLVLDQFEELFIRFSKEPEKRRLFISFLYSIFTSDAVDIRILLSLREDYVSRLDEFREICGDWFQSDYRLPPLTAFGARQAITRPLIDNDIRYDGRVITRIIDIIAPEEFDSVLLQIICTAVIGHAIETGSPTYVRESDLDEVGGLDGILKRFLERATQSIPPEYLLLTRTVLDAMVTSESTKRAVTINHLMEWDFASSRSELHIVMRLLAKKRLVREEERIGQMWYELAHERLAPSILQWFQLDKTFSNYRFTRELITNNSRDGYFRNIFGLLLTRDTLRETVRPFRERMKLTASQKEFLFTSAVYYRAEDDVEYWGRAVGPAECTAIVKRLLASKNPDAQEGALWTAGTLGLRDEGIPDNCLALAMQDTEPEVCDAACRAFPAIAGPAQIACLRKALADRKTRKRGLRLLSEFDRKDKAIARIGWVPRHRARQLAEQRIVDRQLVQKADRIKSATIVCMTAALVWILLIGLPFFWMMTHSAGEQEIYMQDLAILLPLTLPAPIGWYLALRTAARAGVLGKRFFVPVLAIAVTTLIYTVILALTRFGTVNWERLPTIIKAVEFSFLIVSLAMLAASIVSGFISRKPYARRIDLWTDAFLLSAGPPLLAGCVIAWLLARNHQIASMMSLITGLAVSSCLLGGTLSFQYARAMPGQVQAPTSAWWRHTHPFLRSVSVVCIVLLGFWFQHVFGWRSVPLFAKTFDADAPLNSIGPFSTKEDPRSGWSRAYYIKLHSHDLQYYRVNADGHHDFADQSLARLFIPAVPNPASFDLHSLSGQSNVAIERVFPADNQPMQLSGKDWTFRTVTLAEVRNQPDKTWQADITLQTGLRDPLYVELACLPFTSAFGLKYPVYAPPQLNGPRLTANCGQSTPPFSALAGTVILPTSPPQAYVMGQALENALQLMVHPVSPLLVPNGDFMRFPGSAALLQLHGGQAGTVLSLTARRDDKNKEKEYAAYPWPATIQLVVASRLIDQSDIGTPIKSRRKTEPQP